ncbi:MAG: type II toxin-antitoxin system RelE/ParE family toxin [Thermoanaerobaculia bacterium]
MSGGRVEFFPDARAELEDAFDWYLERSPDAAGAFLNEVDRALERIAAQPQVWPKFEAGTRRYVLGRFPYSLFYRETATGIEVVALAHHKRRPRYWGERVGP